MGCGRRITLEGVILLPACFAVTRAVNHGQILGGIDMRKTLCGLGLALALLGSGCAPTEPATNPSPNATSARTEVLPRDVASVDLTDSLTVRDTRDAVELESMPDAIDSDAMRNQNRERNEEGGQDMAATDTADRTPEMQLTRKAMQGHLAEQQLAKLAVSRSNNEEVQEVARMIEKDHQLAEQRLRQAALTDLSENIELNQEQKELHNRLNALQGEAFDQAYIEAMVKDHEKDLKMYREQAKSAPTEALRGYFAQHVTVLEKHLKHCQSVRDSLS
jgi:putative membrane protein